MAKKPTEGSFIAKALIADRNITAYYTKFSETALMQMSQRINNQGVPMLLGHKSDSMPTGAWFEAEVQGDNLYSRFYVPKELPEHDDIKARIETDVLDSVSVGFSAEKHTCSICGNDIYDYKNCEHIPGQEYDGQTCFAILDDVNLAEISLVYSGAVRNAKILEYSNKKEFCDNCKLNFSDQGLKIVHKTKFDYALDENPKEGSPVMEELLEKYTQAKEEALAAKEENLKYKEEISQYKEEISKYKEKAEGYDAFMEKFKAKVEAIAAPFDAEYKAPEDADQLFDDLQKFLDQAKALPSGQQSVSDEEPVSFEAPTDAYKI